jgi:hypothetical protein
LGSQFAGKINLPGKNIYPSKPSPLNFTKIAEADFCKIMKSAQDNYLSHEIVKEQGKL